MKKDNWPKEKIIEKFKEIINKIGPIKKKDLLRFHKEHNFCSYYIIQNVFGSIDNFEKEVKIDFIKLVKKRKYKWPKEKIFEAIHIIINKHGLLKKKDIILLNKNFNFCSYGLIIKIFGSLDNFAKEANFQFINYSKDIKWQKKNLIDAIYKIIKKIGPIMKKDLLWLHKKYNISTGTTICRIFGTLDNFAEEANFQFKKRSKWSKNKIKEKFINHIKKFGSIKKKDLIFLHKYHDICSSDIIRRQFGSLDIFINEVNYNFLPSHFNSKSKYGKHEKDILDSIEKEKNIKIERQFSVQYYNKYYFLDGYDLSNRVPYEVDERHHKYQQIKDKIREQNIITSLGCRPFIRINEQKFLQKKIISLEDF